MIVTKINYPQALEHDFDAVVRVVPPGAAFSPYNPCCAGSFYGTGCTADCADAIAWAAYSRAWADSMSGIVSFCGGNQPVIRYEPPAPLDWGDAP